jgi:hypothetical protein
VRVRFGEDRSERLDYRPASLFIAEHVRAKYVCRRCAGQIVTAPAPAEAVPRCVAGPGLLAHTHKTLHDLAGAVDRLPSIVPNIGRQVLSATGTDDASAGGRDASLPAAYRRSEGESQSVRAAEGDDGPADEPDDSPEVLECQANEADWENVRANGAERAGFDRVRRRNLMRANWFRPFSRIGPELHDVGCSWSFVVVWGWLALFSAQF